MSPLPPPGRLRTLALATLANTVGTGLWVTGVALYLTRVVGLSPTKVGLGLTLAGLVGLTASVPLGALADRRDPRALRAVLQVGQAVVASAYLLVDSFPVFLVVATLDALLVSGNLAVRAALIAAVAGPEGRVQAFATLRAVANLGIAVGAGLAGFALAADTGWAYRLLVVGNVATYLVSAALVRRLPAYPPTRRPVRQGPGRALRDGPFLAVAGASAVLSLHSVALTLVLPLWVLARTDAPPVTMSAVLLVNTLLTVLLAVRLSRGAQHATPRRPPCAGPDWSSRRACCCGPPSARRPPRWPSACCWALPRSTPSATCGTWAPGRHWPTTSPPRTPSARTRGGRPARRAGPRCRAGLADLAGARRGHGRLAGAGRAARGHRPGRAAAHPTRTGQSSGRPAGRAIS
ncbi:hypothetical protein GCM10027614_74780 [Micromonospora vulcania]